MNKTIWKYDFSSHVMDFWIPKGAEIIHVDVQNGVLPTLWAIVDQDAQQEKRRFEIVGTGHRCDFKKENHIGTGLADLFVWHVFEVKNTGATP